MTKLLSPVTQCVLRTADDDEQAFYALVAAEAGLRGPERTAEQCPVDSCHHAVQVRVAVRRGCVVGFYQVGTRPCTDSAAVLDFLFVHQPARRSGVGRALFADLHRSAVARGVGTVRIVADPAAESFFHRVGAERVGTVSGTSSVPWSRPEFRIRV